MGYHENNGHNWQVGIGVPMIVRLLELMLLILLVLSGEGAAVALLMLLIIGTLYLIRYAAERLFPGMGKDGELVIVFGTVAILFGYALWQTAPDFLSWLFGWWLITALSVVGLVVARFLLKCLGT